MFPFLWKGADGVVAFEPCCGMHSWNMICERPPRLRPIRRLRGIFLYGAATPPHEPHEEGTTARLNISAVPSLPPEKPCGITPAGCEEYQAVFLMLCKFGFEFRSSEITSRATAPFVAQLPPGK